MPQDRGAGVWMKSGSGELGPAEPFAAWDPDSWIWQAVLVCLPQPTSGVKCACASALAEGVGREVAPFRTDPSSRQLHEPLALLANGLVTPARRGR